MLRTMSKSQEVLAMYGLTLRVVCLKPWCIVPGCVGFWFQTFSHVKKLARPTPKWLIVLCHVAAMPAAEVHGLAAGEQAKEPNWSVCWKIGIVNALLPKASSARTPALIADNIGCNPSTLKVPLARIISLITIE